MLTQQYRLIVGQSGETYYKHDDQLTEIPTNIPSDVVEVTILSQQITTVKANAFVQLSQCTHLRLGYKISQIEPGVF